MTNPSKARTFEIWLSARPGLVACQEIVRYSAPHWCKMKHTRKNTGVRSQPKAKRMSITVPPDHHDELSRLADQKKVSVAWLVREAVEKYLAANAPLFAPKE